MPNIFKSYRKESKENYGQYQEANEHFCTDQLKIGALLRIADAVELVSNGYQKLVDDRDYYERRFKEEQKANAGLRGYIHRIKNAHSRG